MGSMVADVVQQLVATEIAIEKLGARGISMAEAEQTLRNLHVLLRNRRGDPARRSQLTVGSSSAIPTAGDRSRS
jgi:hypothetical protein